MNKSVILCVILLLTGCTILPERLPQDLYQLPPATLTASTSAEVVPALRIDRPGTSETLSGNRLLVMAADNQFQAYAQARWTAPLPLLWRDWLLDAFWRDGRVLGLSAASEGLQAPMELGGMLRAFHVDQTGTQAYAVVQYDALLINTADRRIQASRRFEAREPVVDTQAASAVQALGLAASRLARELVDWTINPGEPTGERRVSYRCDNGERIEMRFFPLQGVGVLLRNGNTMELQQEPAATGFRYINGPSTVYGKGDELRLEIGRMVPIQCQTD
jgi:cholesterol transport system auxiliary component